MLIKNVISNLKPDCGISFRDLGIFLGGYILWYSTEHFAALKKWRWITYQWRKFISQTQSHHLVRDRLVSCFLCWSHNQPLSLSALCGLNREELLVILFRMFLLCQVMFRLLYQNHCKSNAPWLRFKVWDPLVWKSFKPSILLRTTNIFNDCKRPT